MNKEEKRIIREIKDDVVKLVNFDNAGDVWIICNKLDNFISYSELKEKKEGGNK